MVVASIYVNPTQVHCSSVSGNSLCTALHVMTEMGCAQFSATEDFGVYPNSRVSPHTLLSD